VILDLVINAMEAMQDHGGGRRLIVRTRLGQRAVEIVVSDTGPGVPEEQKSRLFEPFFTTKREGLGLGLSTARSIMDAHGGAIRLDETAGATGAAFCVALPRLDGSENRA
jgi:signal transduction histidine kinase